MKTFKYGQDPNQSFDIFEPSEITGHVVIFIHGGAWHLGSKESGHSICRQLYACGHIAVSVGYRLSSFTEDEIIILLLLTLACAVVICGFLGELGRVWVALCVIMVLIMYGMMAIRNSSQQSIEHPAHINDVIEAFQSIRSKYPHKHIFLMGHSAGAHLVALAATAHLTHRDISGAVCISGVYSRQRLMQTRIGNVLAHSAFGQQVPKDAFAIHNIQAECPPFLLVNARMEWSLKRHTFDFFYALREAGIFVRSRVVPGSHFSVMQQSLIPEINTFFNDAIEWRNAQKNTDGDYSKQE